MSNYLRGVDISQYNPGQISKLCSYFQSKGTPLDIVQVELTCGSTIELTTSNNQDDPDPQIIKVIKDANDNNLKIGYYAYIYPYKEGWSTVAQQATAFANAYNQVKQELGITPDCKIMLDIENKAFKVAGVTKSSSIGNQMVTEFVNTVNGILGEQEYVVYSSESGITAFFGDIDVSQFGLVISAPPTDECLSMEQITYPTTNPISGFSSNWNGNWTGVQFAFGSDQDYDIYTEDILITNNSLKIGTEVKITSGKNFAPNLIPANEKGVSYTIEIINGSMCKLSGINEWVNFENLNLVSKPTPPAPKSNPITSLAHPKGSNKTATQIYNLCKNAGWSIEAICGMLGNLSWESYLEPTDEQQGGGGGYGLAQWSYSDLEAYAQQAGVSDFNTISGQIDIIIYQMNNNGGGQYFYRENTPSGNPIPSGLWLTSEEFICSNNTPGSLAQTWMYYYEAPGTPDTQKRIEGAEYWYAYFS